MEISLCYKTHTWFLFTYKFAHQTIYLSFAEYFYYGLLPLDTYNFTMSTFYSRVHINNYGGLYLKQISSCVEQFTLIIFQPEFQECVAHTLLF
jgi:hypothetical protein